MGEGLEATRRGANYNVSAREHGRTDMSDPSLDDHRKAFEDSFFPKEPPRAHGDPAHADEAVRITGLLSEIAGAEHNDVLEKLDAIGISADVLTVLSLFPLVSVAWADDRVDPKERLVVLESAVEAGITPGDLSHSLLENWLTDRPDPRLLEVWKSYVGAVAESLGDDWSRKLEHQILSLCQRVAEATGGFLALDKISSAEYEVLRDLREAFE
jgi:hypothetical protein